jgi:hypothetical protein
MAEIANMHIDYVFYERILHCTDLLLRESWGVNEKGKEHQHERGTGKCRHQ